MRLFMTSIHIVEVGGADVETLTCPLWQMYVCVRREDPINKNVRVLVLAVPTNKCTPFTLLRLSIKWILEG